ncbi:hypothetical protein CYMTET_47866 [Cymbomonas tetramitiformis]|uniref:Uncharacterized protein n=1 Tax=Cymbomonas tetramitiformis TaxID=36881 RepID=A0AAE0EXB0_9CHLO|nr:hypothetical protein CYMTET_47866 [Cymbomonas tetramitiformis]
MTEAPGRHAFGPLPYLTQEDCIQIHCVLNRLVEVVSYQAAITDPNSVGLTENLESYQLSRWKFEEEEERLREQREEQRERERRVLQRLQRRENKAKERRERAAQRAEKASSQQSSSQSISASLADGQLTQRSTPRRPLAASPSPRAFVSAVAAQSVVCRTVGAVHAAIRTETVLATTLGAKNPLQARSTDGRSCVSESCGVTASDEVSTVKEAREAEGVFATPRVSDTDQTSATDTDSDAEGASDIGSDVDVGGASNVKGASDVEGVGYINRVGDVEGASDTSGTRNASRALSGDRAGVARYSRETSPHQPDEARTAATAGEAQAAGGAPGATHWALAGSGTRANGGERASGREKGIPRAAAGAEESFAPAARDACGPRATGAAQAVTGTAQSRMSTGSDLHGASPAQLQETQSACRPPGQDGDTHLAGLARGKPRAPKGGKAQRAGSPRKHAPTRPKSPEKTAQRRPARSPKRRLRRARQKILERLTAGLPRFSASNDAKDSRRMMFAIGPPDSHPLPRAKPPPISPDSRLLEVPLRKLRSPITILPDTIPRRLMLTRSLPPSFSGLPVSPMQSHKELPPLKSLPAAAFLPAISMSAASGMRKSSSAGRLPAVRSMALDEPIDLGDRDPRLNHFRCYSQGGYGSNMQGLPQPLIEFSDAMDGDSEDPINAGSPEGVDDESSSDSWDTTDAGETFDEPPIVNTLRAELLRAAALIDWMPGLAEAPAGGPLQGPLPEHIMGNGMGFGVCHEAVHLSEAAAATLGEQEEPCLRPWERLSSTILPPSESFSYPDPNVLTVAGCGSHALHRRVLDLAWQQKETAKYERKTLEKRRLFIERETQLGHMPTQLYDSVASLMASLPSYT